MTVSGIGSYVPTPYSPDQTSGLPVQSSQSSTTTAGSLSYTSLFSALRANGLPAPRERSDHVALLRKLFDEIEEANLEQKNDEIVMGTNAFRTLLGQLEDLYSNSESVVAERDAAVTQRAGLSGQVTTLQGELAELVEESNRLAGEIEDASGDERQALIDEKAEVDNQAQALTEDILTLNGEINTLTYSIDQLEQQISLASTTIILLVSMVAWDRAQVNTERDHEDRQRVERGERLLERINSTVTLTLTDELVTAEFRRNVQQQIEKLGDLAKDIRAKVLNSVLDPFSPQSYNAVDTATASMQRDQGGRLQVAI